MTSPATPDTTPSGATRIGRRVAGEIVTAAPPQTAITLEGAAHRSTSLGATRIGTTVSEQIVAAAPPHTAITWGGAAYRRTSSENITDLPLYGLDIETDTTVDGLDPEQSAVVAASVVGDDVELVIDGPEPSLLRQLDEVIAAMPPGVLTTWNGAGFDLPFLLCRARLHGVGLGLRVREHGASWHQHRHLDGYRLYRADVGRALRLPCGLKAMARLVGLPAIEVDASMLHLLNASEVRRYVASDARVTRQLVLRRWPAAAAFVDLP